MFRPYKDGFAKASCRMTIFFSSATPSLKTVLEHKKSMPQSLHYSGHIGIDEAGRGALAGPVVCAAVFFPKKYSWHTDVQDSKKLSGSQKAVFGGTN